MQLLALVATVSAYASPCDTPPLFLTRAALQFLSVVATASAFSATKAPTTITEFGVTSSDGYRLSVLEASGAAPRSRAVLLLHGRTWSSEPVWRETGVLGALGDRDHYAMDFRGFGRTPERGAESLLRPATCADAGPDVAALRSRGYDAVDGFGRTPERGADSLLRPSTCAADVRTVVAALRRRGYDAVDVVGWSYGALVAQLVADVADRLVLYASVWDEAGEYCSEFSKWTCDEFGCSAPNARGPQSLENCLSDFTIPGSISEEKAMAFGLCALEADPICVDWADLQEFEVDLAAITCPTLVVHGDRDPEAPVKEQRALFAKLGAARKEFATIDTADHVAHVLDTSRDAWTKTVTAFLDSA